MSVLLLVGCVPVSLLFLPEKHCGRPDTLLKTQAYRGNKGRLEASKLLGHVVDQLHNASRYLTQNCTIFL